MARDGYGHVSRGFGVQHNRIGAAAALVEAQGGLGDRHSRRVVVGDGHRGRGPGGYVIGHRPEAQRHALTIVVYIVGGRAEGERLLRVSDLEDQAPGHAGVIARAGVALWIMGQPDGDLALGVGAQSDRNLYRAPPQPRCRQTV